MSEGNEKRTILVVDDAPENIDVLSGILKSHYRVKAALSGEQSLKVVTKNAPDLILLDVLMPGMDGYEVCRRLKGDPATASIPVIFVTGEAPDSAREAELGAAGTVTKPIDPAVLLSLISDCF